MADKFKSFFLFHELISNKSLKYSKTLYGLRTLYFGHKQSQENLLDLVISDKIK